jgi:hypothetical protein
VVFSPLWLAALVVGVATTVLAATFRNPGLHIALVAVVCFSLALYADNERRRLTAAGTPAARIASANAMSMALVWTWAAMSLLLTYVLILHWGEWWQYVLGAGVVAGLCFGFAAMLARDAASGSRDEAMLKLARYLTIGQLAGMTLAMIALVLDSKMPRALDKPDWAASTIFFFGAAALAAISLNGLRPSPQA